jgi:hypothetical protein
MLDSCQRFAISGTETVGRASPAPGFAGGSISGKPGLLVDVKEFA